MLPGRQRNLRHVPTDHEAQGIDSRRPVYRAGAPLNSEGNNKLSYPLNPTPDVPVKVALSPIVAEIGLNGTLQLQTTLLDPCGNVVEPVQPFTFQSSNSMLVTVDSNGLCTAASEGSGGQATISVSYPFGGSTDAGAGKISADARITVIVPPASFAGFYRIQDVMPGTPRCGAWSRIPVRTA